MMTEVMLELFNHEHFFLSITNLLTEPKYKSAIAGQV